MSTKGGEAGIGKRHLQYALLIITLTVTTLLVLGRTPYCPQGDFRFGTLSPLSPHTSQHIFDPYSVTHFEHGVIFFLVFSVLFPMLSRGGLALLALLLESSWEVIENTPFIINRYRTATFSLDYFGDSILNSLSDIAFCMVGFWVATKVSRLSSVLILLVLMVFLLLWIRDCLALNVLMLLYPIESIREWQSGEVVYDLLSFHFG